MKNVIHLFPAYKLGGAPICILRFIDASNNIYNHSAVAKLEDSVFFSDFQKTCSGNCYNIDLTKFSLINFIKLLKIVLKIKPNIIHVHGKGGAVYGFLIGIFLFNRFKIFYTYHGFYKKWKGIKWKMYVAFERLFSLIYDKSIAVSNSESVFVIKSLKISNNKITVIPNGVSISNVVLPEEIKSALQFHDFNIVTLSRFSHQKDLETMIKSFFEINKKHSIGLHIFGGFLDNDVLYYNKILKMIKDLDLENEIYIWGEYTNASSFIKWFDIYWSTAKFEGLPTAIIEAFLNKTLVVGTKCRGNIDLVFNGKTGYLTEICDVKSNINVINETLNKLDSQLTKQIINSAYACGLEYSIDNNIKKINMLYSGQL